MLCVPLLHPYILKYFKVKSPLSILRCLQVARDEAAAGRQGTAWEGEELTRLRDQLAKARQRAADLEQDLATEREALTRFRSAERTVCLVPHIGVLIE